ncbi:hypothetical protein D3C77_613970 [compost metagenome]
MLDGSGQRQNGFTRTRGAGQVDQVDIRIKQRKQCQALMDIPRLEPPGFLVQQWFLVQVEQEQLVFLDAFDPADKALLVDDELVDVHRWQVVDHLYPVPGATALLAGLDLADAVPE